MAPAIIAVGAFVAANAAVISLAISVAAVGYSLYVAKKGRGSVGQSQSQRKQMLRSSSAPKSWLYGENESAGLLLFAEEEAGEQEQHEEEKLHLVMTHSGTPIDSIVRMYVNDDDVSEYVNNFTATHYPQGRTTADPYLLANTTSWRDDMIGKDFAWFRATLTFDPEVFMSGIPNITAHKKGRRVLDPRKPHQEARYSDNVALCILDFLRNHPSLGYEDDELIMELFIHAANICDEYVDIYDSNGNVIGQERRYRIGAEFDINEDPSMVLDNMLAACGGEPIKVGGRFGIHVGAYYGPTTKVIDQDMIIAPVSIQPEAAREESYNVVRGIYNSKDNRFQETDYPEVRFDEWITEDGDTIIENLDLRYVNVPSQCQRLAALQAARTRFGMFVELPCNMRGLSYPPGTMFKLNLDTIGMNNVEFKVTSWRFDMSEGVTLICRRESAEYYDNQRGHAIVLPPLLNIPTGGVPMPSDGRYSVQVVGEVIQGVVSWTNSSFKVASTEVNIRDISNKLIQSASVPFPGNSIDLNGKLAGTYTAELFAVSMTGAKSAKATVGFTVAAPSNPDNVSLTPSNWSVQVIPSYSAGQVPINTLFEFWHIEDTTSYLTQQPTYGSADLTRAKLIFTGSTFNQGGLVPDRWQHYWVRAVNAYGKSGFSYFRTGTTKNQDLVTTVVERLEAIEIVSSNYEAGRNGYKLSPNGDVEFNNGDFRGDLTATSLTFVDAASIPDSINNDKAVTQAVSQSKDYTDANFVPDTKYAHDLADIQAQIDKSITSWFGDVEPTAGNYPASNWTTDAEKDVHLGDLYYDNANGLSYRWTIEAGVFQWTRVVDSGIQSALAAAAKAQDTADSKRRVFFATPVAPYDKGDLWDTGNGMRRANVANAATFNDADWLWATDAHGAASAAEQAAKDASDPKGSAATAKQESVQYTEDRIYPDQSNIQIKSGNYLPGSRGWAIDSNGNAEFYNAKIRGTLHAQDIVGDIVSGITKVNGPQVVDVNTYHPHFSRSAGIGHVHVRTPRPWDRTLIFTLRIELIEQGGESYGAGCIRMFADGWGQYGDLYSREYWGSQKESTKSRTYTMGVDVTMAIPIPANTVGGFTMYAEGARKPGRSYQFLAGITTPSTNNVWGAYLVSNGGDLA